MGAMPLVLNLYDQGQAVSGAKVYTYVQSTTTSQTAYTDSGLTTPAANPAIADSQGRVNLYLDDTLNYTVTVKSADDSFTFSSFNVNAGSDAIVILQTAPFSSEELADIATVSDAIDAGTLDALVDPSTYLRAANNLSDVANAVTAAQNLDLEIGVDVQAHDADLDTYAANPLTADELGELQNIGTTTISADQWGYLGAMGAQPVENGDNVSFPSITNAMTFNSTGIYNSTTGSGANVNADNSGAIRRSTSALKYKTDLEDLGKAYVDKFFDVCAQPETVVWYRSKPGMTVDPDAYSFYGMIADRFAPDFPQLCDFGPEDENGNVEVEGFAYERTVPFLVSRILELTERVKTLEGRTASEAMLSELEAAKDKIDQREARDEPPEAIADLFQADKPLAPQALALQRLWVKLGHQVQRGEANPDEIRKHERLSSEIEFINKHAFEGV